MCVESARRLIRVGLMSNTRRPKNPSLGQAQATRRTTQSVVVVVALLCVGAVVALGLVLRGGGADQPGTAGALATSAATGAPTTAAPTTSGGTPSSVASSVPTSLHCQPAPPIPTSPQSFSSPPPPSLAEHAAWVATVATNCGDITLHLDGNAAPQTVSSFIFLSQHGFFDNSPCHRLTTGGIYVLQCGDPTGVGSGGPGYSFGIENAPKSGDYPTGTVAMARSSSPDSNGSQFFLVYQDTKLPTDAGGYSIFGTVSGGLGIVKALAQAGVAGGQPDGAPAQPISILGVTVAKG